MSLVDCVLRCNVVSYNILKIAKPYLTLNGIETKREESERNRDFSRRDLSIRDAIRRGLQIPLNHPKVKLARFA